MKKVIEKCVSKHTLNLGKAKTLEDYAETENNFTNKLLEAINYTRCCKSDSELLVCDSCEVKFKKEDGIVWCCECYDINTN